MLLLLPCCSNSPPTIPSLPKGHSLLVALTDDAASANMKLARRSLMVAAAKSWGPRGRAKKGEAQVFARGAVDGDEKVLAAAKRPCFRITLVCLLD